MSTAYRPLIGIPAATLAEPEPGAAPTYRFNGNYPTALAASGALPVIIPLDLPADALREIFSRLDGLCLAGGVDVDPAHYDELPHLALGQVDPARDRAELMLARWALAADMPILGICRGIQLLNVAAGGSLYQDIPAQLPAAARHDFKLAEVPWEQPTHRVQVTADSRLATILGATELMTNSYHHQALKRVAEGFQVTARTDDGTIEGIEHRGPEFVVGVQWHPEGMFRSDAYARRIFEAFVRACRDGK